MFTRCTRRLEGVGQPSIDARSCGQRKKRLPRLANLSVRLKST